MAIGGLIPHPGRQPVSAAEKRGYRTPKENRPGFSRGREDGRTIRATGARSRARGSKKKEEDPLSRAARLGVTGHAARIPRAYARSKGVRHSGGMGDE
jgi:hypothetical protein